MSAKRSPELIFAQSAFARHVLDRQLGAVALLDPSEDKATRTETDIVFNDGWPICLSIFDVADHEASVGE